MNTIRLLCVLLLAATITEAPACELPGIAQIPAEESIRENRKTLIQLDMIRYIGAMSSYVQCLQDDHEAASADGASPLHLSLLAVRNNQAIAEIGAMEQVYAAYIGPIDELTGLEQTDCIDAGPGMQDIVLDNQRILFYTRRDEIFLNVLGEGCPILWPNNSSLRYSMTKPARFIDNICTGSPLLDATTRAGTRRCLLGPFYAITENEAALLRGQ